MKQYQIAPKRVVTIFSFVILFSILLSTTVQAAQIVDANFEEPVITTGWAHVNENSIPGWDTTAPSNEIELWQSGFQGVDSFDGNQHAEINYNSNHSIYQDIGTIPGSTLTWYIAHRGRSHTGSNGTDTAHVLIGVPGGTMSTEKVMTTSNSAWIEYSGTYVVPAGQTTTRFEFDAISSQGNDSYGNFIDHFRIEGLETVLSISKKSSANGASVLPGDTITYTIIVENDTVALADATGVTVSDILPGEVTYVSGSAQKTYPETNGSYTTDTANAPEGMVTVADNITLKPGETLTVELNVTVDANISSSHITNTAIANCNEGSDINDTVADTVNLNANLVTTKVVNNETPYRGSTIIYTITVTNYGSAQATGITLTDQLPGGVTYVSDSPSQGTYNDGSGLWTVGVLSIGAVAELNITARVD